MKSAPRVCTYPGCGKTVAGGSRCAAHPFVPWQRPARKASRHARGYGSAWDRLRAAVLAAEPLCRACSAEGKRQAAITVDHIVPKAEGGTDDRANLQPLCGPCRVAKDRADALRGRQRKAPGGG